MHTTNYYDTFIAIAPDSGATEGIEPPRNEANPSVASRTFHMIVEAPYAHTSDDVIFGVYADRNGISEDERPAARERFFSKGQPCLRSSDLGKRYGWGVHSDGQGRVALYAVDSEEYRRFASGDAGETVTVKYAMRSARKS